MSEKRCNKNRDNRKKFGDMGNRGDILISVLVFASITVTMTIGLVSWGATLIKSVRMSTAREQAFQIAEAGVNYYQWHLAQFPTDFQDGTGSAGSVGGGNYGPYVHNFQDKYGATIGSYSLTITPPPIGSTKVVITSKGTVNQTASSSFAYSRTIQTILAVPSLAQYAVVANDNMRFGSGTIVNGSIKSNYGIHFDGVANNIISSAQATYVDPDTSQTAFGVYTQVSPADPQPPASIPSRPDVFSAGRQFPVPAVDFSGLLSNLQQLQTIAQSDGVNYTQSQYSGSSAQGYHVVLNTNGTYGLYVVRTLVSAPSGCTNSSSQTQWGTWSINTESLIGTYSYPAHGVLFFQDHVWVSGQINGARLTIAAGKFPDQVGQEPNITVNSNLLYTHYDGTDVIGLVAQGNINIGLVSPDTLRIDGALIAENGRVGRFYYGSSCKISGTNYYTRSSLTLDGMIATNKRYGFAYTDGTGYDTRNLTYDANLLYSPPPSFPLAGSQYIMISWKEI